MLKSEPDTINYFQDNFRFKFLSKFFVVIDAY